MLRSLSLAGIMLVALPTIGQRYFFENISVQQGLPASKVYTALQDGGGTIWLGTEAGLASYDGITITSHGTDRGTAPNGARSLFLDRDSVLWVGHLGGGLSVSDGTGFRAVTIEGMTLTSDITGITQDAEGALWLTTFGQGVFRIKAPHAEGALQADRYGTAQGVSERVAGITRLRDNSLILLEDRGALQRWLAKEGRFAPFTPDGLPVMHRVTSLYEDAKGGLWVGTFTGGAVRLEQGGGGRATTYDLQTGMPSNFVFSFGEDALGRVWIGTWDKGAVRVEEGGIRRFDLGNGLHSSAVRAIMRDREGNLLICTNDNGVDLFKGERFVNFGPEEGLIDPHVWAVMEDRSGRIWFGTDGGISILDPSNHSTARVKNLTMQQGALTTNRVRSLQEDRSGHIWIGTDDGGLFQFDPASFRFRYDIEIAGSIPENKVTALVTDARGDIWVGTINGLVRYRPGNLPRVYTIDDGLPANNITALAIDPSGVLWVGCLNKGVARIVGEKALPVALDRVFTPTAFTWDDAGRTWIGSEGSGIRVLGRTDTLLIGTAEGLLSNAIRSLITDKQGNVWIGTNRGLNVMWKGRERPGSFTERSGFAGIEARPHAVTITRKGTIWFGTSNGATRVDPGAETAPVGKPPVAIRRFSVNLEDRAMQQGLELGHTERDIRISYGCVSLADPNAVFYQYMMLGLEDDWQPVTQGTDVHYPALPPGNYVFRVRAMDRSNIWSDPVQLEFTILPPWYRRWWAYTLFTLVIVGGVFSYIKVRERQLRLRNLVLERKVQERTAEVRAQNREIEGQKVKIEELLLNILPREISEELKVNGKATARHHDDVTVMFTDMKGFTKVAEKMTPQQLVSELDECFIRFDAIVDRYGIEKIKTIGDSYMCACGVPTGDPHHAVKAVMAAIDIREEMNAWKREREARGMEPWVLRIGLHSGPVVAGVVGKRKFAYDIWGDTVNTASRLESSGVPGEVNISGSTYALVSEWFECEHRGRVQAKNKGEIDMYFVRRIKPEFSADPAGTVPNERFRKQVGLPEQVVA